jgi:hypothetical protein
MGEPLERAHKLMPMQVISKLDAMSAAAFSSETSLCSHRTIFWLRVTSLWLKPEQRG